MFQASHSWGKMYQEERVRNGNVRAGNPLPEEQIRRYLQTGIRPSDDGLGGAW
jgi:hypothetical protein